MFVVSKGCLILRRKKTRSDVHVVAFVPFHILSAKVTCSVFTSLNYPHVHCNLATMSNFNNSIPHMIVFNITHLYTRSYHHVHLSFAEDLIWFVHNTFCGNCKHFTLRYMFKSRNFYITTIAIC